VEGGYMGFGQLLRRFVVHVHHVAIFRNLLCQGLFIVDRQDIGEGTGGTCLDQIGDFVTHADQRFAQPPDDAFGATVKVDGDFGIVDEEDFHGM
jgi:hypothetical protein